MDCALYFTHTFVERGSSSGQVAATTLLLDQSVVKLVEGVGGGDEGSSPLAGILSEAQLNGVSIDTVVPNTVCVTYIDTVMCI